MANRDVTNYRQVTEQAAPQVPNVAQSLMDFGNKLLAVSNEAKINNGISQAQLELGKLNNDYQIKYQSNPNGGMDEYISAKNQIFEKYGADISPIYRNQWLQQTRELSARSDLAMQNWQFNQSKENAVNDINDAMKANFIKNNMDGRNYGNGTTSDLSAVINFQADKNRLIQFGNSIGTETTNQMLKDYNKDALKSFISGVAETNRTKAVELLKDENVTKSLNQVDIDEIAKVAATAEKKYNIDKIYQQVNTEQDFLNQINSGSDYYSTRLALDKAELNGQIESSFAEKARKTLSSEEAVDAITNKPMMSKIVEEMYDLNAQADNSNNKDYLLGIRNIQNKITDLRSSGNLSQVDANKLLNQSKTLFSAKQAKATNDLAYSFKNGNAMIKQQLPPEYQADATRQLFYMVNDSGMNVNSGDKNAYNIMAQKVIDNINGTRRDKVLQDINNIVAPVQQAQTPRRLPPAITEGTVIQNKTTGEKMIFKDGKWRKM